jgi:hypothetical protein
MTQISSVFRAAPLLSPRTADYVSALIREGDNFDYAGWLQQVRAQDAQAQQSQQTSTSRKTVAKEIAPQIARPESRQSSPTSMRLARHVAILKGMSQLNQGCAGTTSAARIRRWFEKIRDVWNRFQTSRARDAVYAYLEAVFAIVTHYKVRRKTKKLLRHAFKLAELPFDRNADPFTAVIRCTCADRADSKTISKWARALRYVARCKERGTPLKMFMKEAGGVNACADRYAQRTGRRRAYPMKRSGTRSVMFSGLLGPSGAEVEI